MIAKIIASLKAILKQVLVRPTFHLNGWTYDHYWDVKRGNQMGTVNDFQKYRANWIASRMKSGASVLDIGSGDGAQLFELLQNIEVKAIAADCSDAALQHLQKRGVNALKCDIGNMSELQRLPQADHVLMLEVIEHTPNPEALLLQAMQLARVSVFFSIPNTGYLSYRLRLLFGRFPVQWRSNPGEHLRFWTLSDLHWWTQQLGVWDQTVIHGYEGVPGLNRLWPSLFSAGLIAEVRRKDA